MNLREFPGVSYPIGTNLQPPDAARQPQRPRGIAKFTLPPPTKVKPSGELANQLPRQRLAERCRSQIGGRRGAWRSYEFNITDAAKVGAENALAVQVSAPTDTDLAITFVDWNPAPPDRNMGLWREVYVSTSGPVALRYPTVVSHVDASGNAQLSVTALLKNATVQVVKGTLKGKIENTGSPRKRMVEKARCLLRARQVLPAQLHESSLLVAGADGQAVPLPTTRFRPMARLRPHRNTLRNPAKSPELNEQKVESSPSTARKS